MSQDEEYMQEALHLAACARGRTSPNPMVGAVIVRADRIVGVGWHRRAGTAHAEIHALHMAGELAAGATLYVTLEPCSHYGRTGPCAKAIVAAGLHRVVIAMLDPNPLVSGKGAAILRQAGIEVSVGVLGKEARLLNEVFLKWIIAKMPFVSLKTAMSLDGKIATVSGQSQWITNEVSRLRVHEMRDRTDAIITGIGTVQADDPSLTTRLPSGSGHNALRVIVDSRASISLSANVLSDGQAKTLVAVTEAAPAHKIEAIRLTGAEVVCINKGDKVDLKCLLAYLGQNEVTSVLVEAGGTLNFSFLQAGLVDKIYAFIAPKIIGGKLALPPVAGDGFSALAESVRLVDINTEILAGDVLIVGYVQQGGV